MTERPKKRRHPQAVRRSIERRFYVLFRQGTRALHDGDLTRAVYLLERAHQLDSEHVDAALNLGGAYILSKRYAEALAILEPLSKRQAHNGLDEFGCRVSWEPRIGQR